MAPLFLCVILVIIFYAHRRAIDAQEYCMEVHCVKCGKTYYHELYDKCPYCGHNNVCPECGYPNLKENEEKCPECGHIFFTSNSSINTPNSVSSVKITEPSEKDCVDSMEDIIIMVKIGLKAMLFVGLPSFIVAMFINWILAKALMFSYPILYIILDVCAYIAIGIYAILWAIRLFWIPWYKAALRLSKRFYISICKDAKINLKD